MTKIVKPRSAKSLAAMCARLAQNKLGKNIVVLNLEKIETSPAEYFVICTSDSDLQSKAIVDLIKEYVRKYDLQKPTIEGLDTQNWVLIDFFDVVVHIMLNRTRKYYQIEKLWADAKFTTLNEDGSIVNLNIKDFDYE